MVSNIPSNNKKSLANYITRVVVFFMGVSLIIAMLQHYRFSSNIINEEIDNNLQRVSSLIQNQFDYHLNIRQIQQDRNANSQTVAQLFNRRDKRGLDYYFLGLDESTPQNTPDIRFIFDDEGLFWDDGNAQFYGLSSANLIALAKKVAFSYDWYSSSIEGALGKRHVLMRRAPMIEQGTGRVLSQLYIVQILDNSFSLVESLQSASDTFDVMLSINGQSVADTLNTQEVYSRIELSKAEQGKPLGGEFIASTTRLSIDGEPSPLVIVSVLNNSSIEELKISQLQNLATMLAMLLLLSLGSKWYFERQVAKELSTLMLFTKNAGQRQTTPAYSGSKIKEFHHIGYTLENTFEKLMERERSFQDLFNFSPSLVIIWDSNLHVLQINPAAREVLDHQEGPSNQFSQFLTDIGGELSKSLNGEPQTEVYVPVGERVFRWTISPVMLENGLQTIITQGTDVTSLIEAEKQSERARLEAEKAAVSRADFLARMSHEIRTPLNGILGVSQLLKQSVESEEQRSQVDVLRNSGEHLLEVLNDVLDFSKIEQGKLELDLQEFEFVDLAKPIGNIFQTLCTTKGIDFDLRSDIDDKQILLSDQTRIRQIVLNLVSNAVKFTHKGRINVDICWSSEQHKYLNIQVTDTGIGIAEARLENMFEPFVQAEPTITREYGGSGLGLTIVKNLVDMLNGQIAVESQLGVGTRFTVNIPVVAIDQTKELDESVPEIDFALFKETQQVLLVEDNHTNAFIAQAFCHKYKMEVTWAKDGQEALELARDNHFDLVLMDNQLPTFSGIDTTSKIRNELGLSTPIFACTADGLAETREAFYAAGANYVLVKPLQEITLYQAFKYFKQEFKSTPSV